MSDDVTNGYINAAGNIFLNIKPLSFYFSLIFHVTLVIALLFYYSGQSGRKGSLTEVSLLSSGIPDNENKIENAVRNEEVKKVLKNTPKSAKVNESDQKKNNIAKQPADSVNNSGNNTNQIAGTKTANGNSGSGTNLNSSAVESDYYYVAVDQMPVPIGGMQSILSRMNIPENEPALSSIYILAFIDEYGVVQKCLLVKGIGNSIDQLAVSVVRKTKFQPGVLNGKRVKVQLYLSIPAPVR